MSGIKTFWCEPTGRVKRSFRCYEGGNRKCGTKGYCDAQLPLDIIAEEYTEREGGGASLKGYDPSHWPVENWPTACAACGLPFEKPMRQIYQERMFRRTDTGAEISDREFPPGAMYDAEWLRGDDGQDFGYTGPDGIALTVVLPDLHHWQVDSEANNCDRRQHEPVPGKEGWTKFRRTHYCWCRHGDPRTGAITVDKNGPTCKAGAGSILTPKWHGFLRDGVLTP